MYMSASAPEAPPLSETTIGVFINWFFWIAACIIRAIWSEAPPAPAATTISTGLVGSQAAAGTEVSASASAVPHRRIWDRVWAMAFSLNVVAGPLSGRGDGPALPHLKPVYCPAARPTSANACVTMPVFDLRHKALGRGWPRSAAMV